MSNNKITTYPGNKINVTWDSRLCIHIGECGNSAGELFVGGRDPWCQPDLVDTDNTIDVVQRCPSGALAYQCDDASLQETAPDENSVQIVYNGPLFVNGDLEIDAAADDMPSTRFRAALCRCGLSKNKPFCDNSHIKGDFQDAGACGETGEDIANVSGQLTITALEDGPIMLQGNFQIIASSGRVAWRGSKAALCRCGQSGNKPFCDGSHKAAGFKSG